MLIKPDRPSLPRNLALRIFGKLPIVFSTKVNLLYLFHSIFSSDKTKLIAKNFLKNSNPEDFGIPLPVPSSRTNLKLHNVSATPKMVKKVIMNLDSSKASGLDCVPVVVLKDCNPELSKILAELFNMSEAVLFSRLLEGLMSGPFIQECWGKVCS